MAPAPIQAFGQLHEQDLLALGREHANEGLFEISDVDERVVVGRSRGRDVLCGHDEAVALRDALLGRLRNKEREREREGE